MGSSDRKTQNQSHPRGCTGHHDKKNIDPKNETAIPSALDAMKSVKHSPNAKHVKGDTRSQVDQGHPSYAEARLFSPNGSPPKPSSPSKSKDDKSRSNSKSTSTQCRRPEDSKEKDSQKCMNTMSGVSIVAPDPRSAFKRYKFVL